MTSLDSLQNIFRIAYQSELSSFYRDFYTKAGTTFEANFPKSVLQWQSLPFLTKRDLVAETFYNRLFVPIAQAGAVRITSGTSKRGILLFPRNEPSLRTDMKGECTSILSLYFPHYAMDEWARMSGIRHTGSSPSDLPAAARLATLNKADALAGSPNALTALVPFLKKCHDVRSIRYILLFGGRASKAQFLDLREAFPNARITWEYSSIEGNGRTGRACKENEHLHDNLLHFDEDRCLIEIVNSNTNSIIEDYDQEGELILTTTWTSNALPILRYRTGDLIKKVPTTCSCQNARATYQVLGRVEFDRAAIPGGELQSQELERVLAPFRDAIDSDFELHIYRDRKPDTTRLVLRVRKRNAALDTEFLLKTLSSSMRISPTRTLADAVEQKLLLPLECDLILEEAVPGSRLTRIRERSE